MQCPSCRRAVDESGVFPGGTIACAACGAEVRVASSRDVPTTHEAPVLLASTCPRCGAELALRYHDTHVVSVCPDGHGVFVTRATLKEIRDVASPADVADALDEGTPIASSPSGEADGETTRACPRCHAPMTKRSTRDRIDVVVDACAEHGIWFDSGELRAVLDEAPRPVERTVADAQAKATLDVALAFETAREHDRARRDFDAVADVFDLLFDRPYGGRRRLF